MVSQANDSDLTAATRLTPPAWPPPAPARLRPPRHHPADSECPPADPCAGAVAEHGACAHALRTAGRAGRRRRPAVLLLQRLIGSVRGEEERAYLDMDMSREREIERLQEIDAFNQLELERERERERGREKA